MVRISENKLTIEINCNNPLSTLADFQKGLLNMMEIANLNSQEHAPDIIKDGMFYTSRLIKEMLISPGQNEIINDTISKDGLTRFNNSQTTKII